MTSSGSRMSTGVDDAGDAQSLRGWIAAALRDGVASMDSVDCTPDELLAQASWEGVLPLLEWRLRNGPDWSGLPGSLREGLAAGARTAAMQTLFRDHELQRISQGLSRAGIRALLLKGPAFARWLYPALHLRVSGDMDLLFRSRAEAEHAARRMAPLGYDLAFMPGADVYEMTARRGRGTANNLEIDLHWRLINTEAYASVLSFDPLWAASMEMPGFDGSFRRLGEVDAFIHACLHRAHDLGLQRPDRMKWVYDIHLMLERMDAARWPALIHTLQEKRVVGVCLRSIHDTMALLHSPVDEATLAELETLAAAEPLDWRRLHDWRYMQWQNLRALPTARARARWLWERLIPTRSHLRELYGEGNWWRLMGRRIVQGFHRLK